MRSDTLLGLIALLFGTATLGCAGSTAGSQRAAGTMGAAPAVVAPVAVPATQSTDVAEAPAIPPAVPVEFAVAVEGRCKALDVSFVGDDTYVHAHGWIGRVGEAGTLAERIDTSRPGVREARWHRVDNEVLAVVGHQPEPMIAMIHRGLRGDSYIGTDMAKRTAAGKWTDIDLFGKTGYARQAWPWYDNSILVLGERRWFAKGEYEDSWSSTHEYAVRFGVARGRPKGPHLSAFKTAGSNCPLDVWVAHATTRGDVVALVGCRARTTAANHGTWVMRWFRDDLEGSTHKLSELDFSSGRIAIGPEGQTVVAIADDKTFAAFELDADSWRPLEDAPPGKLVGLGLDPDKRVWIATDKMVVRGRAGEVWDLVGPTEAAGLSGLAGVEFGTPWVLAHNGAWAGDAHGRWTAAVMPAPAWFPNEDTFHAQRIMMPRAGEVWIRAQYESPWPANMGDSYIMAKVDYTALLSNAKVDAPLRCGTAVDPAYPEIDLRPWPLGHRAGCTSKLVMLMRLRRFDGLDGYGGLRKVIREHAELRDVTFVEVEGAAGRLLGAMVTNDDQATLLGDGVRGYRSGSIKPEASCGDDEVVAAAGFRVVRRLRLQPDGRAFREAP